MLLTGRSPAETVSSSGCNIKLAFLIWNTKLYINFASSLLRQTGLRHTLWNTTLKEWCRHLVIRNTGPDWRMPWLWTGPCRKDTIWRSSSGRYGGGLTERKPGRFSEKAKCPADEDGSAVMVYRIGILAWYDCNISTGKVEGINNKIKVMKRTAYGFRDERYFILRLFALHDCRITQNVGWT